MAGHCNKGDSPIYDVTKGKSTMAINREEVIELAPSIAITSHVLRNR